MMPTGSVIVDISSNSAYVLPKILINKKTFALENNLGAFYFGDRRKIILQLCAQTKGD